MYQLEQHGAVVAGRTRVEKPGFGMQVYVYYIDGLLIDTGPQVRQAALGKFLDGLAPVEQVVLTHLHEDHCGGAAYVAARRQIAVGCHPDFFVIDGAALAFPFYRRVLWGQPQPFPAVGLGAVVETAKYRFHVLPTPGHAPEHLAFYEREQGWLFSGDLFLSTRFLTMARYESPQQIISSLQTLLSLDFEHLFCAHVGLVSEGQQALAQRLQTLQDIQGQVERLAQQGLSQWQVTRRLFPGYWHKPITWLSGGEYSSAHIVRAFWPRAK